LTQQRNLGLHRLESPVSLSLSLHEAECYYGLFSAKACHSGVALVQLGLQVGLAPKLEALLLRQARRLWLRLVLPQAQPRLELQHLLELFGCVALAFLLLLHAAKISKRGWKGKGGEA